MSDSKLSSATIDVPYSLKSLLATKGKESGIKEYKHFLELVIEQAVKEGFVLDAEPSYQTRLYFSEETKTKMRKLVTESKTVRERWILKVLENAVKD